MMKTASILLVSFLALSCGGQQKTTTGQQEGEGLVTSEQQTVATTRYGKIAGYIDRGVYIYKGVPYGQAERFMAPTAPKHWEGVRSCRTYGPTCPQEKRAGWQNDEIAFAFNWNDGFAGEDCLRLNIWTKGLRDGQKRPVMVWLHGGGYAAGSGQELPSYDGRNLADRGNVVVVTINHRLNVLGFLDLSAYGDKYAHSGNAGLMDIVSALEWVKANVSEFGGDPTNVTIFGQSGGGGKVSTLLATPSAKGLFHKAIIESGSMLRTMSQHWSCQIGKSTVEQLGLTPTTIDQLKSVPYEKLLAAGTAAIAKVKAEAEKEGITSFMFGWAPTVDGDILPRQPFDPQAPEQSKDIPLLIGTTKHEFTTTTYVPALRNISEKEAVEQLHKKYGERTDEWLSAFKEAYPEYDPKDLIDIDLVFRPNAVEQGRLKAAQGGAPVWMYLFTWQSPVLDGILRSTHCMEIPFVFNNVALHASMTGGGKEAVTLGETMSDAWVSFARTGSPVTKALADWESFTNEGGATMIFDTKCKVVHNHDKKLIDLSRSFSIRGF